jgi:fructose-1,6-bisphosphatase/inositol monophosphatase family enzyme
VEVADFIEPLRRLHDSVRRMVVAACEARSQDELTSVSHDGAGDITYAIDLISEDALVDWFTREIAVDEPIVLIGEGLPDGRMVLPADSHQENARWRIIVDPIDGTRGLMYQKRSAWVLTGVARNRGAATSLQDIVLAVQTEIPLVKQHLSDELWAVRGEGAQARRYNRLTGECRPIALRPSTAPSIAHGYASIARFFPGARDELAAIDEAMIRGALGAPPPGRTHCFEDQYAYTGGQLYELLSGHDRFIADLRPLMRPLLAGRGYPPPLTCHPYDICTALIAEEGGVIVTDPYGRPIDAPLNVEAEVAWAGYANAAIHMQVEPLLQQELRARRLIESSTEAERHDE